MSEESLSLSDAIAELRCEIDAARKAGEAAELRFPIARMTVELNVVATSEVGGRAGFRVPIVNLELGGSAVHTLQATHRIAIEFEGPVDSEAVRVKIGRHHDRPLD